MLQWGMIPKRFDTLMQFVGITRESRRRYGARIELGIREAAAACIWAARKQQRLANPSTAAAPRQSRGQAKKDGLAGDRGTWEGTTHEAAMVAAQLKRMQSRLAHAEAAAAREEVTRQREARLSGACTPQTPHGIFTRCKFRDTDAGGTVIAAAGDGTDSLRNFERQASAANGRGWKTLAKWWTWSDERLTRQGTRFAGLNRQSDGVCRAKCNGVQCGNAGYLSADGAMRCGSCRNGGPHAPHHGTSCDHCGTQPANGEAGAWTACGTWHSCCPTCTDAIRAMPPNETCDCCGKSNGRRATADGSSACLECVDDFSQVRVWLARAQILCERARHSMGLTDVTSDTATRSLWLHAASKWAAANAFCGNAITWREICRTVLFWEEQHGVMQTNATWKLADDGGGNATNHTAMWSRPASPAKQQPPPSRTLLDMGFTGRTISSARKLIKRSVHTPRKLAIPPPRSATPVPSAPKPPERQLRAERALEAAAARRKARAAIRRRLADVTGRRRASRRASTQARYSTLHGSATGRRSAARRAPAHAHSPSPHRVTGRSNASRCAPTLQPPERQLHAECEPKAAAARGRAKSAARKHSQARTVSRSAPAHARPPSPQGHVTGRSKAARCAPAPRPPERQQHAVRELEATAARRQAKDAARRRKQAGVTGRSIAQRCAPTQGRATGRRGATGRAPANAYFGSVTGRSNPPGCAPAHGRGRYPTTGSAPPQPRLHAATKITLCAGDNEFHQEERNAANAKYAERASDVETARPRVNFIGQPLAPRGSGGAGILVNNKICITEKHSRCSFYVST
jgi:hypothetical protein